MKKRTPFIKKLIAPVLFIITVALYFNVNYTTAINLSSVTSKLTEDENKEGIDKDAFKEAMPQLFAYVAGDDETPKEYNNLYNASALNPFFEKLAALESQQDRKINIVHIGDSHIQADVMTNIVRQRLQEEFGNAGLGLVFPYSLIRTNGGHNVSFTSNISWSSEKNTSSATAGITGYSLTTNNKNFVIELNLKNKNYTFNTVKIITPNNQRLFELATNVGKVTPLRPSVPKTVSHKVEQGQTLYGISKKYHTTVPKIQQANGLKTAQIRIGQVLRIPTKEFVAPASKQKVDLSNATILNGNSLYSYYSYDNLDPSDKIYLTANTESSSFTLNGIVLENDKNGVIYHSIGVNGAHFSDYNKSQLFFEQIKALDPDLIIISLGTNEAYGRMSASRYDEEVNKFIKAIRAQYGQCPILLTTPPPSLYKKKNPNPLCVEYADTLIDNSVRDNYSVFDLYRAVGGNEAMQRFIQQNLIAGDRVHYTRSGYTEQGALFYDAFMSNYLNYKKQYKLPLKPYLN